MGTRVTHAPSLEGQTRIAEALEQQNKIMAMIAGNTASQPQTFADIKRIVRSGLAKNFFNIGDQVVTAYAVENGATYQAPWDVKHIDDTGVYLGMHYALPDTMMFDAPEAIYYAESGLPAGTYNITIGDNHGTGWIAGNRIKFSLTQAVPVGGQIFIDCEQAINNNPADGRTVTTYGAIGAPEAIETSITSSGSTGTSLGTIYMSETNGGLNAICRCVNGYGRYSESSLRQWLNSDKPANSWWVPQNNWDRPPRATDLGSAGFLSRLPADFVAILDYTNIDIMLSASDEFDSNRDTVRDRIWLPSLQNCYIEPLLNDVEGPAWDYYKTLAQESGITGRFQRGETYEVLKNYRLTSAGNALSSVGVYLRTISRSTPSQTWYIGSSGKTGTNTAAYSIRCCPACKIKSAKEDSV